MTTQMFLDRFMVSSGGDTILHDGGAAAPKLDSKNRASNKLMVNSMARERILPRALQPGDKIAVLSPAGPVSEPESLKQGLRRLQSWGFSPKLSAHAKARNGYLPGSDRQRAADLQDAIDDKSVRAVVCSRGGYGTMRILNRIDFSSLRHDPKPILGYSDITALLAAAWKEVGLISFHGPMAATSAPYAMGKACSDLQRNLLTKTEACELPPIAGSDHPHVIRTGTCEGPLVGGNLSLVCALMGTPWEIDSRNAIVFLEDIGEDPYRIDRMLTQLLLADFFEKAAGVLMGDFHTKGTRLASEDEDITEVFLDRLRGISAPVVHRLPFGHRPGSWTLPFGGRARIEAPDEARTPRVSLLEAAVR